MRFIARRDPRAGPTTPSGGGVAACGPVPSDDAADRASPRDRSESTIATTDTSLRMAADEPSSPATGDDGVTVDEAVARYGTTEPSAAARVLSLGPVSMQVAGGTIRSLSFDGTEVLRGLAFPVRDADSGTMATATLGEEVTEASGTLCYRRTFIVADAFDGDVTVTVAEDARGVDVAAALCLTARCDVVTNRAGFVVLHPLAGVVGEPVTVRRADGSVEELAFPRLISPGQPVRDIAGLAHVVNGVTVQIAFKGDVFEMEDQRNWTDATFKTYCRPLAAPRPYTVAAGERVQQAITIRLGRSGADAPGKPRSLQRETVAFSPHASPAPFQHRALAPAITLALDEAVAPLDWAAAQALAAVPFAGALVRLRPETAVDALAAARRLGLPLALEVVVPEWADLADALARVAAQCAAAGLAAQRVVALPEAYLASIQPAGPWPAATPEDAAAAACTAFPDAVVGSGMLTYFTELNRRPPRAGAFVTFGTAAIVHAADDASVLQTLEALPDVFASAGAIAGSRPLHLGLVAIGMRSNPYGAATAPNPDHRRVEMALADPRQRGLFAAAFAIGAARAAAEAGVASLALGMAGGPLGLTDQGTARPVFHVARALAGLSGRSITLAGGPGGLVEIAANAVRIITNLGADRTVIETGGAAVAHLSAATVAAARDPAWLDRARRGPQTVALAPLDVVFLTGPGA